MGAPLRSFSDLKQNIPGFSFTSTDYAPLILKQGSIVISPSRAEKILKEAHFEGQRDTDPTYVAMHRQQMRRGSFLPNTQIAFCKIGDKYFLVNGKHRITAVSLGAHEIEFSLVIYECKTMDEVRSIYARFDSITRPRTNSQIRDAFDLAGHMGVSARIARAVYDAVPMLTNRLQPLFYKHEGSEDARIDMGIPENRNEAARAWSKPAQLYEKALKKAPGQLKSRLLITQMISVALMTLKHTPDQAFEFWEGVALDDGLRRGDPRKTLLTYLANNDLKNKRGAAMIAGVPWNAFFKGEKCYAIQVRENTEIKILGTPLDGRRK